MAERTARSSRPSTAQNIRTVDRKNKEDTRADERTVDVPFYR